MQVIIEGNAHILRPLSEFVRSNGCYRDSEANDVKQGLIYVPSQCCLKKTGDGAVALWTA